ncbi:EAL domain-containing protein [Motiliproteus sediminis]|uniref:EAL domain-containing protein n=1 Tax=Motiliproteus sediminis TaxID=1468178 RepID=UPI001AEF684D|nr:EAL domain-containing protein [Motiliproteus sediminis]
MTPPTPPIEFVKSAPNHKVKRHALPIELNRLQQICHSVAAMVGCKISIMAGDGEIVASSVPERIGIRHEGAARILRGEIDELEIDAELSRRSGVMLEGCNLGIDMNQQRVLCVGVAAALADARQFASIVKACIEEMLKNEVGHLSIQHQLRTEINERKLLEQSLAANEVRFRQFAETSAHWLWEMDAALRFSYFSARLKTYLGLEPKELIGKTRLDLTRDGDLSPQWQAHLSLLERHEPFSDFEYDACLPNGEQRIFRISGKPLFTTDGRFDGYRGTGRDVTDEVRSQRQADQLKQRLDDALEAITDGLLLTDSDHRLVMCNTAYRQAVPAVAPLLKPGIHIQELNRALLETGMVRVPREHWDTWLQNRWQQYLRCDKQLLFPTLNDHWIEVNQYRAQDGGTLILRRDITERMRHEERQRLASTVFDNTQEGIIITDAELRIIAVNPAFTELTGYSEAEAIGKKTNLLKSGKHDQAFYQQMWDNLNNGGQWCGEVWNRRKNGEVFPEWLSITEVRGKNQELLNYVAVFSDISAVKETEQQLEYLAHHDPLTELPNRMLFMARLKHGLQRARREGTSVALLFLDLDHFKKVNDSLGHAAGDQLLLQVAERLSGAVREQDTVARLGGDEFTLLLEGLVDHTPVDTIVSKLLERFREPFQIEGQWFHVTTSIGISISPQDGSDDTTLLRNADTALYKAKERGRNEYQYYSAEFTRQAQQRTELEQLLREALQEQQFTVYYQPQIAVENGRITGAEALVRWIHPQKGMLPPDQFIPLAEETGLIRPLGLWVLEQACHQMQAWLNNGYPLHSMAVNFSRKQLIEGLFVEQISDILQRSGLDARHLEMEIIESLIMEQSDEVMQALEQLRKMGVSLAIDDFGTGYSSLAYLKQLPVTTLKIDRSFVSDIPDDPNDAAIVQAILALAASLHLDVVAEGVETRQQADFLLLQGCRQAQGFYYGRPMPADEFERLLQNPDADGLPRLPLAGPFQPGIDYQI